MSQVAESYIIEIEDEPVEFTDEEFAAKWRETLNGRDPYDALFEQMIIWFEGSEKTMVRLYRVFLKYEEEIRRIQSKQEFLRFMDKLEKEAAILENEETVTGRIWNLLRHGRNPFS
ncbi:MAG: hypothetical protein QF793_01815 [Candidatus Peribacteraceae bacterium]|nr:hypothetical protein [Candidatus Peribacteraceae bacterium]